MTKVAKEGIFSGYSADTVHDTCHIWSKKNPKFAQNIALLSSGKWRVIHEKENKRQKKSAKRRWEMKQRNEIPREN